MSEDEQQRRGPSDPPHQRPRWISPNVPRVMLFSWLNNMGYGVWGTAVWSPFVYFLFNNSNVAVGWIAAINGLSELLAALAASWLADRVAKTNVLWLSGLLGVIASVGMCVAVHFESQIGIYCVSCAFGLYYGTNSPTLEALFADSVEHGQRTMLYNAKYVLEVSSSIVGSIVAFALFYSFGNTWELFAIKRVLYAAMGLHLTALVTMCSIREGFRLKLMFPELALSSSSSDEEEPPGDCSGGATEQSPLILNTAVQGADSDDGRLCRFGLPRRALPYIITIQDTLTCVGAGMTVAFFPLFFLKDYDIKPAVLSLMNVGASVLAALLAFLEGKLGDRFGRLRMMVAPRFLAPFMLLYMALASGPKWAPAPVICALFVVRYSLMNCTTGQSRAIIMDTVAPSHRARWSALESLQSASWAGSGVIGGFLSEKYSYQHAFVITAGIQMLSNAILSLGVCTNDAPPPKKPRRAGKGNSIPKEGGGEDDA